MEIDDGRVYRSLQAYDEMTGTVGGREMVFCISQLSNENLASWRENLFDEEIVSNYCHRMLSPKHESTVHFIGTVSRSLSHVEK